ncbi:DUF6011 domain-containing protein [Mycolicibacterium gilvum]|uniref:DUF6011 domain-containing protein n=1 Tax=Mycolicibacterium gilvum TaxID=1804 RepID=UPI0040465595
MTTAKRNRPSGGTRAASKSTATDYIEDSSLHRAEDGYSAPSGDERREAELLAELRGLGYRISVKCRVCGHPVVSARSVAAHIGPKCRAKQVAK